MSKKKQALTGALDLEAVEKIEQTFHPNPPETTTTDKIVVESVEILEVWSTKLPRSLKRRIKRYAFEADIDVQDYAKDLFSKDLGEKNF